MELNLYLVEVCEGIVQNRLLTLGHSSRDLMSTRASNWEGRPLLGPALSIMLLQRTTKDSSNPACDGLR